MLSFVSAPNHGIVCSLNRRKFALNFEESAGMLIMKTRLATYGLQKNLRNHWQLYALLVVPLALVIIFNYIPMGGIVIAFKDYKARAGIWGSEWVGTKYFQQFFSTPRSMSIITNTLKLSLYSILASFPFPILLANLLNESKSPRLKKTTQLLTYAPYFVSTVVMVGILMRLLDPQIGMINRLITMFGGESQALMAKESFFPHIYVWSGIWQTTGYNAVIYLAALAGISPEYYEAAKIDGASKLQNIRYINLPLIMPTATILLILNFGSIMSVGFEKVFLMQNSANINASEVISTYVYKVGLKNMNMSFSTAINLFNSAINMLLIISVNFIAGKLGDTSLF